MTARQVKKSLFEFKNPKKAKVYARFFKTGPGQYGEGDVFWGLTVPQKDQAIKNFYDLPLTQIQKLVDDDIHEVRMAGVSILVRQFQKADEERRKELALFYLKNSRRFNNWDLVDASAGKIMGAYLLTRNRSILYKLAKSENLWERRIAIIATGAFIRQNQFKDTLKISEILLKDEHDLIHKAVGWMLREVGKRDQAAEEKFLKRHWQEMPRTMLRYAIERFEEKKRQAYLKGLI